jgi:GR25 family glycosyltransferase involved in LPS biosynthesis
MPCILGKKFSDDLICKMMKNNILSPKAEMTKVEISINMSHFNCWKKLVNSCLDYAMILEDDVEVKPNFLEDINLILSTLKEKEIDFSVLHLWNGNWSHTKSKQKSIVKIKNGLEIVKENADYNAGAAAYIISKKYAEWLMQRFFPIKMPQDMLMGTYYRHGNHLSLKMKYRKKDECYLSPVLDLECGGEGGTGTQTTQTYEAPIVNKLKCKRC